MQIGFSTLQDIGSSYYMPLNDKEILVVQEDEIRNSKLTDAQKLEKEIEKEAEEEKESKQSTASKELTTEEQVLVNELQARDTEVRAHESAHQAAGGGLTGGASMTYQQGPDGQMYAIGGEVSISTKGGSTPEETISNAQQVIAAAMAPATPSAQDFAVASSARAMMIKAQQEKAKEAIQELQGQNTYKNELTSQEQDKNISEPFDISA